MAMAIRGCIALMAEEIQDIGINRKIPEEVIRQFTSKVNNHLSDHSLYFLAHCDISYKMLTTVTYGWSNTEYLEIPD